jgi:chromosome segregation ATPase
VPNQRLTFLCGENGSGKSAILTAIVFALGGTARMTNRGSSTKGFIRTNQNSATVDITLVNIGENQYKPGTALG